MNVEQLLKTGALAGPYRRTRPTVGGLWWRLRSEYRYARRYLSGLADDAREAAAMARRTWAHRRVLRTGANPDEVPF